MNNQGSRGRKPIPKPDVPTELNYENYVVTAERVVLHLNGRNMYDRFEKNYDGYKLKKIVNRNQNFDLTTSKIRSLLSLLNVIYQMVQNVTGKEIQKPEILGKIQYLKMRCAYEAGRESAVRDFIEKANIMNYIDSIGNSKEQFILFFHYVESLVAYHRYYGGNN